MTSREAAHQAAKILAQTKSVRLRRIAVRLIKIEATMWQEAERMKQMKRLKLMEGGMKLNRIASPDEMEQEYEARLCKESCTRRIPLGAVVLAGYLAVCLIYAGAVRITADYYGNEDPYVGLADGPYSY